MKRLLRMIFIAVLASVLLFFATNSWGFGFSKKIFDATEKEEIVEKLKLIHEKCKLSGDEEDYYSWIKDPMWSNGFLQDKEQKKFHKIVCSCAIKNKTKLVMQYNLHQLVMLVPGLYKEIIEVAKRCNIYNNCRFRGFFAGFDCIDNSTYNECLKFGRSRYGFRCFGSIYKEYFSFIEKSTSYEEARKLFEVIYALYSYACAVLDDVVSRDGNEGRLNKDKFTEFFYAYVKKLICLKEYDKINMLIADKDLAICLLPIELSMKDIHKGVDFCSHGSGYTYVATTLLIKKMINEKIKSVDALNVRSESLSVLGIVANDNPEIRCILQTNGVVTFELIDEEEAYSSFGGDDDVIIDGDFSSQHPFKNQTKTGSLGSSSMELISSDGRGNFFGNFADLSNFKNVK